MAKTTTTTTTFKICPRDAGGDYRLKRYVNGLEVPLSTYFTDDKGDAIVTMLQMVAEITDGNLEYTVRRINVNQVSVTVGDKFDYITG
jgi:hypothetical protein